MSKVNSIFWFRKDLRLLDNPGLWHAFNESDHVICVYIYQDDSVKQPWPLGSAQKWWLHYSLDSLSKNLSSHGTHRLFIKKGDPTKILFDLFVQLKGQSIKRLYFNHVYEPFYSMQDKSLIEKFTKLGISCNSYNSTLLIEPTIILNQSGGVFKVFTPYWRRCMNYLIEQQSNPKTARKLYSLPNFNSQAKSSLNDLQSELIDVLKPNTVEDLKLLPTHPDWAGGLRATWKPGEPYALESLNHFVNEYIGNYDSSRDKPFLIGGTSRMSPRLALGELGPWQIWHAVFKSKQDLKNRGKERYIAEMGWREFSYYLLYHFPQFDKENFRSEFDRFQWLPTKDDTILKAWKYGKTGYPIVDAGMKQLWYEGYMHNRVRMVTASFLTKDLLIDWRVGSLWFWDTLVDADLANNSSGWQWVAGTGADASPYYRIFNPMLQGEKFDPQGEYVKKWIPALSKVPLKYIHSPWKCPKPILEKCGFKLGVDYPAPIVDHEKCRDRALKYYQMLKTHAKTTFKDEPISSVPPSELIQELDIGKPTRGSVRSNLKTGRNGQSKSPRPKVDGYLTRNTKRPKDR